MSRMKSHAWVLLALASAAGCGPNETASRKVLEEQGFTDIVLTRDGDHFTFEARKGGEICNGTVSASGNGSTHSSRCSAPTAPAEPQLRAACSDKHPEICYGDAKDKQAAGNHAAAAPLFSKGCEYGDMKSCNDLGVAYQRAEGVARDDAKATELYDKACKAKSGIGCHNFGLAMRRHEKPVEARAAFEQSCALGDADGCYRLGTSHANGVGGPKDLALAIQYLKKGCEAPEPSQDACGAIGLHQVNGEGVPVDLAAGDKTLQGACDKGSAEACRNLGILLRDGKIPPKDLPRAIALFDKGCHGTDGSACNLLALANEDGEGVPKDLPKALGLYEKSCNAGHALGCVNYGISLRDGMALPAKDPKKAAEAFDKACAAGERKGCVLRKGIKP